MQNLIYLILNEIITMIATFIKHLPWARYYVGNKGNNVFNQHPPEAGVMIILPNK